MKQFRWVFVALVIAECLIPLFATDPDAVTAYVRENGWLFGLATKSNLTARLPTEVFDLIVEQLPHLFNQMAANRNWNSVGFTAASKVIMKSSIEINEHILERDPHSTSKIDAIKNIVYSQQNGRQFLQIRSLDALRYLLGEPELATSIRHLAVHLIGKPEFRLIMGETQQMLVDHAVTMGETQQTEVKEFTQDVGEHLEVLKFTSMSNPTGSFPNLKRLVWSGKLTTENFRFHAIYPNLKEISLIGNIRDVHGESLVGYSQLEVLDVSPKFHFFHAEKLRNAINANHATLREVTLSDLTDAATIGALANCKKLRKLSFPRLKSEILSCPNPHGNLPQSVGCQHYSLPSVEILYISSFYFFTEDHRIEFKPTFVCENVKILSLKCEKTFITSEEDDEEISEAVARIIPRTEVLVRNYTRLVELDLKGFMITPAFVKRLAAPLFFRIKTISIDMSDCYKSVKETIESMLSEYEKNKGNIIKNHSIVFYNLMEDIGDITHFESWEIKLDHVNVNLNDFSYQQSAVVFKKL